MARASEKNVGAAPIAIPTSSTRAWIAPPYSQLALTYDAALGIPFLRATQQAFECLVRRYRIAFCSAADVGCGTGLFACYLSQCWGVPVFGVDRSPEMLQVAMRNCPEEKICFLQQDIRCLRLPCPVDLITANFDTVNHLLSEADLRLAFQRIAENLRPGGHFLFDVITPCRPLGGHRCAVRRLRGGGGRLEQWIRWDPQRRALTILVVQRYSRFSPTKVELHCERAYSPWQVGRSLHEAGFVIRGVHDAMTLGPTYTCPPRIIVVAQKRPPAHKQP